MNECSDYRTYLVNIGGLTEWVGLIRVAFESICCTCTACINKLCLRSCLEGFALQLFTIDGLMHTIDLSRQ